jgi:hypothetical protein
MREFSHRRALSVNPRMAALIPGLTMSRWASARFAAVKIRLALEAIPSIRWKQAGAAAAGFMAALE